MLICKPVVQIVTIVVRVVIEVLKVVCGWVSSVLTTFEEVCEWVKEKICSWLPWPLNKLCEWVTTLVCWTIKVVKTIWEWVCTTIITVITYLTTYLLYILRWICFFIDWILVRWWLWLLCRLGFRPRKVIQICPVVLEARATGSDDIIGQVNGWLADTAEIFAQCDITLRWSEVRVVTSEYATGTSCGFWGIFTGWFNWFSVNASPGCTTVYFVEDIDGACGCSYLVTDWVTVSMRCPNVGRIVVQEVVHNKGQVGHDNNPASVMNEGAPGPTLLPNDCCVLRSAL